MSRYLSLQRKCLRRCQRRCKWLSEVMRSHWGQPHPDACKRACRGGEGPGERLNNREASRAGSKRRRSHTGEHRLWRPPWKLVRGPLPLALTVWIWIPAPISVLHKLPPWIRVVFDHGSAKQIVLRCLAEHRDLAGSISILLGKFRAASNREIAELSQVNVQC